MPELPEVENLRRSLEPWLVGARIVKVEIRRRGVVSLPKGTPRTTTAFRRSLGVGGVITRVRRHGKQLLLELHDRRAIVIQLGMTGSVTLEQGPAPHGTQGRHRHVAWLVESTLAWPLPAVQREAKPKKPGCLGFFDSSKRVIFRDPRRFGGITAALSVEDIERKWDRMGPDGLTIGTEELLRACGKSSRPIKSFLLDQGRIAGVGNIYADESLFAARVHPLRPANQLTEALCSSLSAALRRILATAIERGGSTLRDYQDAFGRPGEARQTHLVYGRAGQPCTRCGATLLGTRLIGRATVHCPRCQDLST